MYKVHVLRTVIFAIIGLVAGLCIMIFSPKIYEGRIELLLGSNIDSRRGASMVFDDEVLDILRKNSPQGIQTERQLLMSQSVYRRALRAVDPTLLDDWEKTYLMYDVVTARTVNQYQDNAGVAEVRVRAYDRDHAKEIADQIYVAYNLERNLALAAGVDNAVSYLNAQITATETDLQTAESALRDFKSKNFISIYEREAINETDFRAGVKTAKTTSEVELAGVAASIDTLVGLIANTDAEIPVSTTQVKNPNIERIEAQISDLENNRAMLLARYTDSHGLVRENRDALASARTRLKTEEAKNKNFGYDIMGRNPELTRLQTELSLAETRHSDLQAKIVEMQNALDNHEEVMAASGAIEMELVNLSREREIFNAKYVRLKSQVEELLNRQETSVPAAVVMGDQAIALADAVAPDAVKLSFIGFIAGACLGLVMSFALESMRPRVYTSSQLGDLTGLPVVASIPALPGLSRSRAIEALAKPESGAMESFRNMAYSYLATRPEGNQSVMFTGIGTAGSSSIGAAQFAVALAHAGRKVVLVDAERTRQVITNGFDASDKKGVSDAIQQGSDAASMLVDTDHENLRLLPIGTVPEALMSAAGLDKVEAMIASLCSSADVVVIAVAPTDVVADAAAFASKVDEVCLSVSAKSNNYSAVPTAFDILDKSGARNVKLILTDTNKDSEPFSKGTSIERAV